MAARSNKTKSPVASRAAKKGKPARKPGRMAAAKSRPAVEEWMRRVKADMQPLARQLDRLIMEAMPEAVCAVKWGVPFYGRTGQGWIAGINSFKAHVKLLFFRGGSLEPKPPAGKGNTAIDFHSADELRQHEKQIKAWLEQAKKLPGWLKVE